MAGNATPLVIPLKFDMATAMAQLQKLQGEGKAAGDKTAEGLDGASKSAKGLGDHLVNFLQFNGLHMLQTAARGMSQAFEESSAHIKQIGDQFIQLREAMRGLQALEGKTPTDAATMEKIKLSAKSQILSPQEYTTAALAFSQEASGYVSKAGQPGTNLIEQSTVDEILPEMMAYAKARDISPTEASKLIGSIIQTMPKGSTAKDYKSQFMKVMEIAETSKGDVSVTVSQIAPLLAEGVGKGMAFGEGPEAILQAARVAAVESERGPSESFTYSRALTHEMNAIHKKAGAEDALGITEDMTIEQKVKAIKDSFERSGVKKFEDFIDPFAADKIRGTGALQTAMDKGYGEADQFNAMAKASAAVDDTTLGTRLAAHMESEGGQHEKSVADLAREQVLDGQRFAQLNKLKIDAEAAANREHAFDPENQGGLRGQLLGLGAQTSGLSIKQQIINERAVKMAFDQAGEKEGGLGGALGHIGDSQPTIDALILEELKKGNAMRRSAARDAPAPLAAPPPAAGGVR